jgi:enoyl-CoA hydratase
MYDFDNLEVRLEDGVAVVVVNRPKVLNALNAETVIEITECFRRLGRDDEVAGVILTGAGDRSFVAGADIAELVQDDPLGAKRTAERGQAMCLAVERMGKPVIAAVNGFALGGGCELALACTLRTASEKAKIGLPEVTLGIIPGYGGTQRLPRLIGAGRALEMILSGKHVTAEEALRSGLVNHVFPPEELLAETEKLLRRILANGPVAVRFAHEAVYRGLEGSLEAGLGIEADLFATLASSEDRREGLNAFLEKRKPEFRNC